jgi:hypothetical protein
MTCRHPPETTGRRPPATHPPRFRPPRCSAPEQSVASRRRPVPSAARTPDRALATSVSLCERSLACSAAACGYGPSTAVGGHVGARSCRPNQTGRGHEHSEDQRRPRGDPQSVIGGVGWEVVERPTAGRPEPADALAEHPWTRRAASQLTAGCRGRAAAMKCCASYIRNYIADCIGTRNTWPACAPANIGIRALGCARLPAPARSSKAGGRVVVHTSLELVCWGRRRARRECTKVSCGMS